MEVYTHTHTHLGLKEEKVMWLATTWMNQEDIVLSEINIQYVVTHVKSKKTEFWKLEIGKVGWR